MSSTTTASYSKPVEAFLSGGPKKLFIGGKWVSSSKKETFTTLDPGAGSPLAEVFSADDSDVDAAVRAA